MAKVTVVYKMDGECKDSIVGVFSDNDMAWKFIDANDPNGIYSAADHDIDALVDDEFKPELPSNHPCR